MPLKSKEQLDLQALRRMGDRLFSRQTGIVNQIRAFLLERGITFRQKRLYFRKNMPAIPEGADALLSRACRGILHELRREWIAVEEHVTHATEAIEDISGQDEAYSRL